MDYKKNLAIQCRENLNSASCEYILDITDASIRHIDGLLSSLSKMLDNHLFQMNTRRESKMHLALTEEAIKVVILSDLIAKSAEEYTDPSILKGMLECVTMQTLREGDSILIEVLHDNTLRLSLNGLSVDE